MLGASVALLSCATYFHFSLLILALYCHVSEFSDTSELPVTYTTGTSQKSEGQRYKTFKQNLQYVTNLNTGECLHSGGQWHRS